MDLQPGQELGHYRLVEPIGRGGMGEVWKARDTSLDRDVAVKVLPDDVAADGDRLARFQREAKLLASLNHPHIATIHGLHEHEGVRFLAMELLGGEDLAQRLKRGALPVQQALAVALQVGEALGAAHAGGIIHRDLKPANIRITGPGAAATTSTSAGSTTLRTGELEVKVLDFGLAKALSPEQGGGDSGASLSPTLTMGATAAGIILGTAAYMAPEQARGYAADARADVWAFGVVLFEMLTGTRLFTGQTVSDTLAAVLRAEPDWESLPAETPPAVHRLLRRCLAREPDDRLHDIADARLEIREGMVELEAGVSGAMPAMAAAAGGRHRGRMAQMIPWLAVAVLATAALAGWLRPVATVPPGENLQNQLREPSRFDVLLEPDGQLSSYPGRPFAISPDGRMLAVVSEPERAITVRRLDKTEGRELAGTDGASNPFFSPDGLWIGFFANGYLKKVPVSGGSPQALARVDTHRGGWWGEDNQIVYAPDTLAGLHRISADGGEPEEITLRDTERQERSHRWPQVLPNGAVIFTAQVGGRSFDEANIEAWIPESGKRIVLHRGGSCGRYLPSGHLVFANRGTLYAARFDLDEMAMTSSPTPILENVTYQPGHGGVALAFSQNGTILVRQGESSQLSVVTRYDLQGKSSPLVSEPGYYGNMSASPDGRRLVGFVESDKGTDIWVFDLQRSTRSRLTFTGWDDFAALWVPGSNDVVYCSEQDTNLANIYIRPADGSGEARQVTLADETAPTHIPISITPDGTEVLFVSSSRGETGADIFRASLGEQRTVEPVLVTPFDEGWPALSPDGRWLAYTSNESDSEEIYLRSFPVGGGRWQVSTSGGTEPDWSPDGKTLYYRQGDLLYSVSVADTDSAPRLGRPEQMLEIPFYSLYDLAAYSVDPVDGSIIATVYLSDRSDVDRRHATVILNGFTAIDRMLD
ncbi:MAG: protein kinase [Acidobacteria bacterium]|nr:protein kinase [Acidobacteriota bacterium]